jgi:hypothetical protein
MATQTADLQRLRVLPPPLSPYIAFTAQSRATMTLCAAIESLVFASVVFLTLFFALWFIVYRCVFINLHMRF